MHKGHRYRMPVDDFAFARGATAPVSSKQEAEKVWEPKFLAEIASGKDPRALPIRQDAADRPATVADLLALYRKRYVEVEPLKSRAGVRSQVTVLTAHLGTLPATALERPAAMEDFKARYANRAISTTNRYLARLRHVCNWAIGRDLLAATPFNPRGIRIAAKNERRRERRVSEAEEQRLLDACKLLNEPPRATAKLTWDNVREIRAKAKAGVQQSELASAFRISRSLCNEIVHGHIWNPDSKLTVGDEMRDRIIGALDTGCRRGEMLKIQNKHVDWRHRWIHILKEHSKTEVARVIPFETGSRLEKLLSRRKFLGPEAHVFGEATTGACVGSFRSAWETLLLLSNSIAPTRVGKGPARVEPGRARAHRSALARPATRGALAPGGRRRAGSRTADARGARQHHDDAALHERAGELAGGINASGPRTASPTNGRRQRSAGVKKCQRQGVETVPIVSHLSAICQPTGSRRSCVFDIVENIE
jgi:integrase